MHREKLTVANKIEKLFKIYLIKLYEWSHSPSPSFLNICCTILSPSSRSEMIKCLYDETKEVNDIGVADISALGSYWPSDNTAGGLSALGVLNMTRTVLMVGCQEQMMSMAGQQEGTKQLQDCTRLHHATLNSMQFKIYKLLIFLEFSFNIFALQLTIHHWNCKKAKPWIGELGKTTAFNICIYMDVNAEKNIKIIYLSNCDLVPERDWMRRYKGKRLTSLGSFNFTMTV